MPPKKRKAGTATAAAARSKRTKPSQEKPAPPTESAPTSTEIPEKYIRQEAEEFLDSLKIAKSKPPSANQVLQLLVASLILSARMSENISVRSFLLLSDKYNGCELDKLSKASWNELCDVIFHEWRC